MDPNALLGTLLSGALRCHDQRSAGGTPRVPTFNNALSTILQTLTPQQITPLPDQRRSTSQTATSNANDILSTLLQTTPSSGQQLEPQPTSVSTQRPTAGPTPNFGTTMVSSLFQVATSQRQQNCTRRRENTPSSSGAVRGTTVVRRWPGCATPGTSPGRYENIYEIQRPPEPRRGSRRRASQGGRGQGKKLADIDLD